MHGEWFVLLAPLLIAVSTKLFIHAKSPWLYAIKYHNIANNIHVKIKLNANTKMVQRHLISTSVVKISYIEKNNNKEKKGV